MRTKLIGTAFMVVILVLSFLPSESKEFYLTDLKNKSAELLSLNNAGTEFWLTFNPAPETEGGKNELKLYISSAYVTTVTVEINGKGYSRQQNTIPNEIIEFTLTPALGQCYRKADSIPPENAQFYSEFGIHVYAEQPFICYAVTQYQDKGEGYLAIPVSALGKDYIVSSWADDSDNLTQFHPGYTAIVSPFDDNRVMFTLGGTEGTSTIDGTKPGETVSFTIYKGDILLIASAGQGSDLSGSRIKASKPVSVISSNYCADVPENVGECNYITEMEVPTNTWGQTFLYTPIVYRNNNSYVKIFAKDSGTIVLRDTIPIASLTTGGGMLDSGWIKLRADEGSIRPVIFTGDKPINVVQYNCGIDGVDSLNGKPFMMNLTSIEQFQQEIIFCTPEKITGKRYLNQYLNLVYQSSEEVPFPDDLQIAKYEDYEFNWKKVADLPKMAIQKIGSIKDKYYHFVTLLIYGDGVYKIKADNPLTAYAYGFSDVDAYGFATSSSFRDLESLDTLPPNTTYEYCQCCGETSGELVEDMPQDSSRSNLGAINLNVQDSYNYKFSYEDFVPGEDASTHWHAWVIDKNYDARAVITFTDQSGNDTTIVLEYFAMKVAIHPNVIDFGVLAKDEVKEVSAYIINESTTHGIVIDSIFLKYYDTQGFELIIPDLPILLQPLDSLRITIKFHAPYHGKFMDLIGVGDTCGRFKFVSQILANSGTAIIDVSYYDFGDIPANSSANGVIAIRNIGTIDLLISGYTGPRQMSIFIPDLTIEPNNPLKLNPGQVFTYEVLFFPADTIVYTDSMFFISNSEKVGVDSIGELRGRGIKHGLVANSYDWGRRKIDRPGFPAGPYDPDNGYQVIKLENYGSQPVSIYDIKIISDIDGTAFEFNRAELINRVINPNEMIILPVRFHPTTPCLHELIFSYDNSEQSTTQTILRGNGTVPRLETTDIDFDSTIIEDYQNPNMKLVRITNKSASDWPCGDSVTIFDLIVLSNGDEISTNLTSWGTEGFRFDKSFLSFPIKLGQGEYIEFVAEFVADSEGQSTAYLKTVSDAETEVTSKWSGNGIIDGVIDNSKIEDIIIMFPNPADDFLSIKFNDEFRKPDFIKLFDSFRNVVYENYNVIEDNLKIRTSEFASGIYFLRIGNGVVRKVVVVH